MNPGVLLSPPREVSMANGGRCCGQRDARAVTGGFLTLRQGLEARKSRVLRDAGKCEELGVKSAVRAKAGKAAGAKRPP